MDKQKDLTVAEVAEELGLHRDTVKRLLASGQLTGYKAAARWRVTRASLDAFKAAGGARRQGRPKSEAQAAETPEKGRGEQ